MRTLRFVLIALVLIAPLAAAIQEPASDPIALLQEKLDRHELKLDFDKTWGYLPSLLKALNVPISSQTFVFSKTSLQVDHIAPWEPRALYFNDDVYIGAVQGGPLVEIASVNPKTGGAFYTLNQKEDPEPSFDRQSTTCLICHNSSATGGVPGFLMRSVYPDRYGYVIGSVGKDVATDQTPLNERWGGWYVTGSHSEPQILGNWISPLLSTEIGNTKNYLARITPNTASKTTTLNQFFDPKIYLSPHSDIAAIMVLTHQANVHNLITIAGEQARKVRYGGDVTNLSPEAEREARRIAEPLLRGMLFVREAPLSGPMKGTSTFTVDFASQGPRDHRGRSLRDLDLEHRLFKYPLSYLIYSDSFAALPSPFKMVFYQRLREILNGMDPNPDFAQISSQDREAIRQILEDTKPDFAASEPQAR